MVALAFHRVRSGCAEDRLDLRGIEVAQSGVSCAFFGNSKTAAHSAMVAGSRAAEKAKKARIAARRQLRVPTEPRRSRSP